MCVLIFGAVQAVAALASGLKHNSSLEAWDLEHKVGLFGIMRTAPELISHHLHHTLQRTSEMSSTGSVEDTQQLV
jgi:hypothetical protein